MNDLLIAIIGGGGAAVMSGSIAAGMRHLGREVAEAKKRATRALAAVEGDPGDPITGEAARDPLAVQVSALRSTQETQTAQLVAVQTDVTEVKLRVAELAPNGGGSLADAIRRIDRHVTGGPP
ncbi:hypothetical protein I6A60_01975 [Frankia sp. AgB1.9]|uniref:hypothetical protein n=1 Tax=unclassified Frankia TaxID=2632575 RepID=UPI001933113E|nr:MULTISPECIES: hypothetical protein [unclassified Frankia]MBL7490480.1 hypothetical protein [Frankia sp. AgW1.1]MBL7546654.1 hypothetical protein [Frankia sp. AgB1.9]MBL7624676.1 hypothetical protein [Frankia sp. AgB1.8]